MAIKLSSLIVPQDNFRTTLAFARLALGVALSLFLSYNFYTQNTSLREEVGRANDVLSAAASDVALLRGQVDSLMKENAGLKKSEGSGVVVPGSVELPELNAFLAETNVSGSHSALLAELSGLEASAVLARAGLDPRRRPETLQLTELTRLAAILAGLETRD